MGLWNCPSLPSEGAVLKVRSVHLQSLPYHDQVLPPFIVLSPLSGVATDLKKKKNPMSAHSLELLQGPQLVRVPKRGKKKKDVFGNLASNLVSCDDPG